MNFAAAAFGLPFLDPYLQSVTSDFSQGVNFATWGATARTVSYVSAFPLGTQVTQFLLFQKEVLAVLNTTSSMLASRNLLVNTDAAAQPQPGVSPYKKLYNDLFVNSVAPTNGSTNTTTTDPALQRALASNYIIVHPELLELTFEIKSCSSVPGSV